MRAQAHSLSVVKVHSHPTGIRAFSEQDDRADRALLASLRGWTEGDVEHGSVVMLPDGTLFGRTMASDGDFHPIERIMVVGSSLYFSDNTRSHFDVTAEDQRTAQAFGPGTVRLLKNLSIGVAGCSGTGSWVVEMLGRFAVGRLVVVDPDRVEKRNLNRIVASTARDASDAILKVDLVRRSVESMDLGTTVETHPVDLSSTSAILGLAECDVLFGCLDSADGRDLLNRISSCYGIPLFDVGVRLNADGRGGVDYVGGAVHFIRPGGSSLLSRRVISPEGIAGDELRRRSPDEFEARRREGYIRGVTVDSPAVSSVNGFHASMAVNDFLSRIHPFRLGGNDHIDAVFSNITGDYVQTQSFPDCCPVYATLLGRGDKRPLLGLTGASQ